MPIQVSELETGVRLNRNPALDGLRGLAILLVFIAHSLVFSAHPPQTDAQAKFWDLATQGASGVDLFFVLSGYLITGVLMRAKGRVNYFRNFYARRFLRIFPVYYLALAVLMIILPLCLPRDRLLAEASADKLWYFSYLTNIRIFFHRGWIYPIVNHAWTLAIEEQFYLLWPIVVLSLSARNLIRLCVWGVMAGVLLRAGLHLHGIQEVPLRALTVTHLDGLLAGSWIAALHFGPEQLPRTWRKWVWIGFAAAASAAMLPMSHQENSFFGSVMKISVATTFSAIALVVAVDGAILNPLNRFLTLPALRAFGKYSYGFYLFHQPLFWLIYPILLPLTAYSPYGWILLGVLGGSLAFVLAVLSFHCFEMIFLRLKTRFET